MQTEQLLRLLQAESFVSGEWIAQRLGVSRAAVAKAVALLRQEGFQIDAQPKRGYLLRAYPKRLSQEAVRALLPEEQGKLVTVLSQIDSTNSELKRRAAANAPGGSAVLAEQQTGGRGRMGRSFVSPPDAGVYLSVLLRPRVGADTLLSLTAQAAVAVCRAIDQVCGIYPDIKWVNDLQLRGKKICGILTELSIEAESGSVAYAVIGVGVNCNEKTADFPVELQEIAGSIRSETGREVDRNRLAAALVQELSMLPREDLLEEYRSHCVTLGKPITIHRGEQTQEAFALELGKQAELLVAYPDGSTGVVNSGEVSVRTR